MIYRQIRRLKWVSALSLMLLLGAAPTVRAVSVDLVPSKDNTLYEDGTGGLSNGAGDYVFAGQAAGVRRALLHFDVAGNIPAGATIQSVTLTLHCSRVPPGTPPPETIDLHATVADWGEGLSNAGDPGGNGAAATPGDATWIHTFFPSSTWSTAGGDFVATASASFACGGVGSYAVGSTAQMVADVQAWLNTPSANFGWLLKGMEGVGGRPNARRFDSRQHPNAAFRPVLHVEYTAAVAVESVTWSATKGLFRCDWAGR